MTPEEHFAKADGALIEANSTNNTARFWAQMRVSEHHTALGRALSEHEARKTDAKWGTKGSDWVYGEVPPVCGTCDSQHVGTCPAEEPDRNALAEAGKAYNRQANRTAAHDDDINKLNAVINARTAERNTARENESALEEKVRRLAQDVQSRDASITQLLIKLETAERARATIPPYTPIPAARARDLMAQMQPGGGAAELAGQVDDLSAACAQKDQEIEHLTDQVRTLKAKLSETKFKPRIIYGALRPADQVWRTPETTRWRGSRSGWEIEYDAPSEVTAVYVRSVDYSGTDEVGVDLVMRPRGVPEGEMVDHDRLEVLARKKMTADQWRNSEFEHDGFDRD